MRIKVSLLICFLAAGGMAACSIPARPVIDSGGQGVLLQYETDSSQLTGTASANLTVTPILVASLPDPVHTPLGPSATENPGNAQTSSTPVPGDATQAVQRCNLAQAGRPIDITVPDDSRLYPGENFSKTWRLVNAGSCIWDSQYAAVWFSGSDLGLSRVQSFNSGILPGDSVDVTVEMVAPMSPGTYQSNWKLRNSDGEFFGIGPNGDAPFWVRIVVVPVDTPTFTPAPPTSTPTPAVFASGSLVLSLKEGVDLDSGALNNAEEDDLSFLTSDEQRQIIPVNSARVSNFGLESPRFEDCALAPVADVPLPLDALQVGSYLCYRTTLGFSGRIYVANIDNELDQLFLEFVTWGAP